MREPKSSTRRLDDESRDAALLPFDLWNPVVAFGTEWNSRFVEQWASMSGEWQAFVKRRLKEDLKLGQHLAAAKGAEEMWKIYIDFWQKALREYAHEFALLSKKAGSVLETGIEAAQRSAEQSAMPHH